MSNGTLYLCATPIGNLEDVTLRLRRVLGAADAVFCEDTRRSLGLLTHLGIKKPLISCHEHNERTRGEEAVRLLREGKDVAYVSDAGTPGISDPGAALLRACIDAGCAVTALPGASAAILALVLSGLSTERFVFEGFLPRSGKERQERLRALTREPRTIILYESPHRLAKTLEDLLHALGERRAAVLREMTKLHEEALRAPLSELNACFSQREVKGECAIVIEGAPCPPQDGYEAEPLLRELLAAGLNRKDAVLAAQRLGVPRNAAYEICLRLTPPE